MIKTIKKNKAFPLLLLILCMSVLTACKDDNGIKLETGRGDADDIYMTPTPAPEPGTEGIISSSLSECRNEKEMVLISEYYQAIKERDLSHLAVCLSDSSLANENIFNDYKNITDISIKKIYTIPGEGPVDTICYIYYEVSVDGYAGIPSLDEIYTCTGAGAKKIYNGAISKEDYAKLTSKSDIDAVRKLKELVNNEFLRKLEENEGLKDALNQSKI